MEGGPAAATAAASTLLPSSSGARLLSPWGSFLHSTAGKQGIPQGGRLLNWLFLFPQELQCHLCWDGSLEPSRMRSRSAVPSRSLDRRSEAPSPRGGEAREPAWVPGSQGPLHSGQCWPVRGLTGTRTRSLLTRREDTQTKLNLK